MAKRLKYTWTETTAKPKRPYFNDSGPEDCARGKGVCDQMKISSGPLHPENPVSVSFS